MNNNIYDKDFRQKLLTDPKATMSNLNSDFMNDMQVVVKRNSKHLVYFVMPTHKAINLKDDLSTIQAAVKVGCAGTVACGSTAGTIGSISSSVGSVGTGGTLSTAGTASD